MATSSDRCPESRVDALIMLRNIIADNRMTTGLDACDGICQQAADIFQLILQEGCNPDPKDPLMYCAIEGLAKTIERYPTAELSEQPIRTALALLGRRELMPPFDGYTQVLNRAHERIKKAGATNLLPVVCATRSTSPTGARRLA